MVALPPEEERLEETTLRVRLIGTAAASDPRRSVAVIQEEGAQKSLLIRPDQELSQPGVRVVRVERKRVVVDNRGRLEEILFEEKGSSGASSSLRAARSNGRPVAAARTAPRAPVPRAPGGSPPQRARDLAQLVQELAPQPPTAARPESPERATSILTQARIVPRYAEGGRMSGLEVTSIRSGSVLEAAGFQEGDLVVAVNGVELSDAGEGLKALRNAGAGERFVVDVERAAGRVKLQYAPEGP
jgi:type II secretion system protein C